jgi:transposase
MMPGSRFRGSRTLAQASAIVRGQTAGMAGRPTKLTRQVEADLTLMLAQGVPVKIAAAATNVSARSVRRWLHEGDLRERVVEVRAAERVDADATSGARLVVLLLRAAQTDWRASAWWLERRYPERWGAARMQT